MASSSASSTANGAVSLLDLPIKSTVGVDGHIIVLKRDDFVGIFGVPSDNRLHLITARPASTKQQQETFSALTCGFILFPVKESDWIVARRFDRRTEEVGSTPLSELTTANLVKQFRKGQMHQRTVPYEGILSASDIETWNTQTRFICEGLLTKRGLSHGDKVVPGCYEDDSNDSGQKDVDGKSLAYPPIPVLDDSSQLKRTSHAGTKRYLAELSPADRTALFVHEHPANVAFTNILTRFYDNNWKQLLGDIQLSYTMFLHIQCLASMEHWRDLVAMSSMVDFSTISNYRDFYNNLLAVLASQVMTMEQDFFEDIEHSGGNFFVPAIERLCSKCSQTADRGSLNALCRIMSTRIPGFGDMLNGQKQQNNNGSEDSRSQQMEMLDTHDMDGDAVMGEESDNDSDGPIVVSTNEIEASITRSSQRPRIPFAPVEYSKDERESYPLLFAAKLEHEDILMACSRILDEKNDVSLVREAASYLERVEAKRK
jgi:A1 cistron-splicing factor AAR2